MPRLVAASALVSTTFNVAVQLTGYQDRLPLFSEFTNLVVDQTFRPTGAVSNPNDYGYISILGLAFGVAMYFTTRFAPISRLLYSTAIVASLYGVVTSGSRSAIVGVFGGAMYFIAKRGVSIPKKFGLVSLMVLVLVVGWKGSSVFQQRMDSAITQKLGEANVAGRTEAQSIALRTSLAWPMGVGFSNMFAATSPYVGDAQLVVAVQGSDNIYVDFLLGAGVFGLASLLLCFRACWGLARTATLTPKRVVLQAAIVCILITGLGSISPASMFVAPFFFALVGVAALPETPEIVRRRL
jgi:hypothetical protein